MDCIKNQLVELAMGGTKTCMGAQKQNSHNESTSQNGRDNSASMEQAESGNAHVKMSEEI